MMSQPIVKTRREFLGNCGVAAVGAVMPQFLTHTAHAAATAEGWEPGSAAALPGFKDDHILVVIQLSGGNDGLNTIIPHDDDTYYRLRPRLNIKRSRAVRLDDDLSFNKNLMSLKELYDDGRVAVIEGVGYPNPNRSHFRSMEIWQTASDSERILYSGWIGRYFDNFCQGEASPMAGVYIGQELPQAFDGDMHVGVTMTSPENFGYVAGKKGDDMRSFRSINRHTGDSGNETLDFLRQVTENAILSQDRIHEVARQSKSQIPYPPTPLAQGLSVVARMIAGRLGTRIYYISLGGFDTHTNQAGQQDRLLKQWAEGIRTFQRDLQQSGQSRRVLTMTFSEFGRRVGENANGGTDHGTAAPMFLIGDPVRGGLHGRRPDLTDLDSGDLKFTTDFRSVYGSVLSGWFGIDHEKILGHDFPKLDILRA